jgi:hypothetical protein
VTSLTATGRCPTLMPPKRIPTPVERQASANGSTPSTADHGDQITGESSVLLEPL